MHSADPKNDAVSEPVSSHSDAGATDSRAHGTKVVSRVPLWVLSVLAGICAGLCSGLAGESIGKAIPLSVVYPPGFEKMGGYQQNAARAESESKAEQVRERKKASAVFGVLGLALGLALGLVGGLTAGAPAFGLARAAAGGLIGLVLAAGVSWIAIPIFFRFLDPESGGLLLVFMTHAEIFLTVGATAGLALGLGLGDKQAMVRALFGGLFGALIGTISLEIITALEFPMMRTFQPISSEPLPRLLAHVCVAVGASFVAALAVGPPATRPATA